jgi:hypothetical protein
MFMDNLTNHQAKLNYEHLCDLQILLKLAYIFSLLESIHALFKFPQMRNIFVCDLMVVVRFVKLTFSICIMIQALIFLQTIFGLVSLCLNVSMKVSRCNGY